MSEDTTAPMAQLYAALAKAQAAFEPITKNRSVTIKPRERAAYSFRYADLEEILTKTRKALTDNGLSLFQSMEQTPGGATLLSCVLAHQSGSTLSSTMELGNVSRADPKDFGAQVTYFRRYLATCLLGVAADDDLDEDGQEAGDREGSGHQGTERRERAGQQAADTSGRAAAGPKPYPAASFTANLPAWTKSIREGQKTPDEVISMIESRGALTDEQKQQLHNAAATTEA